MRYDLAIIGGGPAGYTAAERAGKAGLKTIIFEQNNLGGVCLNEGCIPTKTLLYSAKTYANAINAQKYGVNAGNATFDTAKIVARKGKVVRKLVLGIKARLTAAGVETVTGRAHIAGAHTIECDGQTYECDRMMLCTGSDTFVPPIDGIGDVTYWTHRDVLDCKELPRTIIIVGGGVIGMELASYLCTMGTGVTVIEMTSEILGNLDGEISAALRAEYAKRGITFMLDTRVTAVHEGGEGITVRYESGGAEGSATAEKLLMSVGRRPVDAVFTAEVSDVGIDFVEVSQCCRVGFFHGYFSTISHSEKSSSNCSLCWAFWENLTMESTLLSPAGGGSTRAFANSSTLIIPDLSAYSTS